MTDFNNLGESLNGYFMPIVVKPAPTPTALGYLKRLCLVVKPKTGVSEQFIQLTDSGTLPNYTNNVNGYQIFQNLNSVYLAVCSDLSTLDDLINPNLSEFFTLLLSDDYSEADIATLAKGNFKGVVGANIATLLNSTTFANQPNQVASCNANANDLSYLFGLLLAQNDWSNLQAVVVPLANPIKSTYDDYFDKKISFIGTDKISGIHKVCGFFCGGRPIVTPYIMEQLKNQLQDEWQAYLVRNSPSVSGLNCAKIQSYLYDEVLDNYIQTEEYNTRPLVYANIKVYMENDDFAGKCDIEISKITAWWRLLTTIIEE